ncbi:MAG: isoprenyl transferase [bacterium]
MAVETTSGGHAPRHVAIIMDGNGRWAKKRHLPRLAGHREGAKAVRATIQAAIKAGVKYLTLYAFSVENWQRPKLEVAGLMQLLSATIDEQLEELHKNNVRLRVIGRLSDLSPALRKKLEQSIQKTAGNTRMTLVLALSYSGRVELTEAARRIAVQVQQGALKPEKITEATIQQNLYTADLPDPDLLIRTSGEMRLSNFLLWQMSYAEIHVTPVLWPDFGEKDFMKAVEDFKGRQRKFGRV